MTKLNAIKYHYSQSQITKTQAAFCSLFKFFAFSKSKSGKITVIL